MDDILLGISVPWRTTPTYPLKIEHISWYRAYRRPLKRPTDWEPTDRYTVVYPGLELATQGSHENGRSDWRHAEKLRNTETQTMKSSVVGWWVALPFWWRRNWWPWTRSQVSPWPWSFLVAVVRTLNSYVWTRYRFLLCTGCLVLSRIRKHWDESSGNSFQNSASSTTNTLRAPLT